MDEYTSEIFMGGRNTIVLHNTCEDSLLAAPIILDLVLLAELSTRIQLKAEGEVCFFIPDFLYIYKLPVDLSELHEPCLIFRVSSTPSIPSRPSSLILQRLLW